jgi:hypothetical protein
MKTTGIVLIVLAILAAACIVAAGLSFAVAGISPQERRNELEGSGALIGLVGAVLGLFAVFYAGKGDRRDAEKE